MNELTQEKLKELLLYDPETGLFKWRVRVAKRIKAGSVAGNLQANGYIYIKIDYKLYRAHRLVWLYMYGVFPSHQIDHIDHNRGNNLLVNLREVTHQENGKNQSMSCINTSGFTGVSWGKRDRKWSAYIIVNSRQIHLGCFDNKLDAINARKEANIKYGYHENHGSIKT